MVYISSANHQHRSFAMFGGKHTTLRLNMVIHLAKQQHFTVLSTNVSMLTLACSCAALQLKMLALQFTLLVIVKFLYS